MFKTKPSEKPLIGYPSMDDSIEMNVVDYNSECGSYEDNGDKNDEEKDNITKGNTTPSYEDNEDKNDEESDVIKKGDDKSLTPIEGMEFDSIEYAWNFYCRYAKSEGFKARKDWERKSRKDKSIVVQKHFFCSRAGWRQKNNKITPKIGRDLTRTGCMAKIYLSRIDSGRYRVSKFIGGHNHSLVSPDKKFMFGDCSGMSKSNENITVEIDELNAAGLRPKQIHNVMASKRGGATKVGWTQKQVAEYIRRGRLNTVGIDTKYVLEYFTSMHSNDPGSYYAIEFGDDGCLHNIFWVDSRSRAAYVDFGDVVTFDTTYKKNQYQMPLAPFTGVNHHGQSILFGCALISDETENTFTWVFKTWLHAMFDCQPKSIITDQDKAMELAISKVLPQTRHRLCKWHIRRKLRDKVASNVQEFNTFETEFDDCINNSESIDAFEMRWKSMIERHGLDGHAWLESLYREREKWISIFLNNTFFAGMSTTQRSESINSLFQGYMNQNTTLSEFVRQYEKVMDKRYKDEIEQDYYTVHYNRVIRTDTAMEKQAADIYTKNIFKKFQKQLVDALDYAVDKIDDDGTTKTFHVKKFEHNKTRTVILDISDTVATCSCMMFQYEGIACRHLLAIFRANKIFTVPERYILRRWTRDARTKDHAPYSSKAHVYGTSDESAKARYNDIFVQALRFAKQGAQSPEAYKFVKPILDRVEGDIIEGLGRLKLNDTQSTEPVAERFESAQRFTIHTQSSLSAPFQSKSKFPVVLQNESAIPVIIQTQSIPTITHESQSGPHIILESEKTILIDVNVQDPKRVATKGRPKTHGRFKPRWEDPPKKRRRCTHCKELGHYCSTCPKKGLSDKDKDTIDLTECSRKDGASTTIDLDRDSQNQIS